MDNKYFIYLPQLHISSVTEYVLEVFNLMKFTANCTVFKEINCIELKTD